MLGVFHTYVPLKPITCTKKSQLMKARYNIACNLSIEDIRILAFYTISSWVSYHLYHRSLSSYLIISNV